MEGPARRPARRDAALRVAASGRLGRQGANEDRFAVAVETRLTKGLRRAPQPAERDDEDRHAVAVEAALQALAALHDAAVVARLLQRLQRREGLAVFEFLPLLTVTRISSNATTEVDHQEGQTFSEAASPFFFR